MKPDHIAMDDMAEFGAKINTTDGGCRVDTHRPLPSCTGPCQQGAKPCPCPGECHVQLTEDDYAQPYDGLAGVGAVAIPAIILCVILLGYVLNAAGVF